MGSSLETDTYLVIYLRPVHINASERTKMFPILVGNLLARVVLI